MCKKTTKKGKFLSVLFPSDIAILQDQMTYPEFKDRLLEDIPYEEYSAAMNGFLRHASSKFHKIQNLILNVHEWGGLGYEGKNTHERPSEKRQQLTVISCTSLEKG